MTEVSKMERVPKAVYTKEFKEEAVKLVTEAGLSIPEVGRRLSVSKSTIEYWVRQTRKGLFWYSREESGHGRRDGSLPGSGKRTLSSRWSAKS